MEDLQDIRDNIEDIWTEWFDLKVTTGANIGVLPYILCWTNQQQHCQGLSQTAPLRHSCIVIEKKKKKNGQRDNLSPSKFREKNLKGSTH